MLTTTDDLRVKEIKELSTPDEVMREMERSLDLQELQFPSAAK